MSALFQSSGYLNRLATAEVAIDFQALPPFLRVLLTTDGTVTKSLEAFFWEPVEVQCLAQSEMNCPESVRLTQAGTSEQVVQRRVQLVGGHSKKVFATAASYIRHSLLAEDFVKKLSEGGLGVGELLRDLGLETYREILSLGSTQDTLWRVYLIMMKQQPFIQVREEFPLKLYEEFS